MKTLFIILFIFGLLPFVVVASELMGFSSNINDNNGNPISSGDIFIEIWDSSTGGNLIYNSTDDFLGNISSGKVDVMLGDTNLQPLNLEYGKNYYMEIYINNDELDFDNNERQIFQSSVGNITSSYISPSNITDTLLNLNSITLADFTNDAGFITTDTNLSLIDIQNFGFVLSTDINLSYPLFGYVDSINTTLNIQSLGFLTAVEINQSGFLTSFSETDPIFLNDNVSLWDAALNKYNSTYDTFAYNQTTPAIDYSNLNFLTSIQINNSYLLIGENTTDVSAFLTSLQINNSYLLIGENQTSSSILDLSAYLTGNSTNVVNSTHLDLTDITTILALLNNTNTFTDNITITETLNSTQFTLKAVHVHKSGVAQSFTAGSSQLVTWNNVSFDPLNIFDDANDRITPNIAGKWRVKSLLRSGSFATGSRRSIIQIRKNGTTIVVVESVSLVGEQNSVSADVIVNMNGITDYFDVVWLHTDSADRNIVGDDGHTFFEAEYIGT